MQLAAAVSYMNGAVIWAVTRVNTPTIMVHFSATSDACNVPYVNVYDISRHCTTTDTEFGIFAFVRKYRYATSVYLWFYLLHRIWYCAFREGKSFKCLFVCMYGTHEQTVREENVLDILNDSDECSDSS